MLKVKIEKGKIYSFIRDKWLVCTPEEEVRQNLPPGKQHKTHDILYETSLPLPDVLRKVRWLRCPQGKVQVPDKD